MGKRMGRSRDPAPAVREKRKKASKRKETPKKTNTRTFFDEVTSMEKQRIRISTLFKLLLCSESHLEA
jgi:hypothetical protein